MRTRVYGLAIAAFIGIHHVGDDVWRIRTQSADGSFAERGGVQAIEAFLGPTNAKRSPRPRGQATLANDRQAVRFQSPEGKLLAVIDNIHVTNGVVTVSGPLEPSEGVFGGGCRFDRLNKRGTEFLLNAEDGWNRNETMYVPIPVFSTSRGGGFLVNTHAVIRLDAGKSDPNRWSIRYLGDHADLYYFTGGTLADVRHGALGLVGVGEKPKLAPGPVICRHYKAKDFDSFEKIRKVYDSYVREGTKPAALIIEPYPIKSAFAKPEAADSLAEMGGFFRAEGVPLMIWMQCGYPFHAVAHGYRPEYVVHCDIRTNGVISAKNSETVPSVRRNGFVNPDAGDQYANLRLLDITNQEAWEWYEENVIAFLVRNNIIGAKIDFCELAPDESVRYGDFSVAYHWKVPDVFKGVSVHHAYPMLFNAKFAEAIKRLAGGRADSFVFCRGGGLGCSRTAYYWAGDQVRTFPKLRDQLRGLLNSRLSAMPYMSFDLAGYIKKWKDYSLAEEERIVVRRSCGDGCGPSAQCVCDMDVFKQDTDGRRLDVQLHGERKIADNRHHQDCRNGHDARLYGCGGRLFDCFCGKIRAEERDNRQGRFARHGHLGRRNRLWNRVG